MDDFRVIQGKIGPISIKFWVSQMKKITINESKVPKIKIFELKILINYEISRLFV